MFEDIAIPGEIVIQRACNNTNSFKNAKATNPELKWSNGPPTSSPILYRVPTKSKWVRPEKGFIKINSHVSLSCEDAWGIGVIARKDTGEALASGTWIRLEFHCVVTAEAWGLYQAAMFARDLGLQRVLFENDNEQLINQLQGKGVTQRSYLGSIINSIISLTHSFDLCNFTHVKRSGNAVAHFPYRVKTTLAGFCDGWLYFTSGQRDRGPDNPQPRKVVGETWRTKLSLS